MTHPIHIFDRELLQIKLHRAAPHFKSHNFLQKWSDNNIAARIALIKKEFERGIYYGHCADSFKNLEQINHLKHLFLSQKFNPDFIADDEFLPLGHNQIDLFISNLSLHHCNDLLGALLQINYALQPDGVFMGTLLGGETLFELRDVLQQAEIEIYGGLSPRIAPFADIKTLGGLMQRAQFALPVIDSEKVVVEYSNFQTLMYDLRYSGESNFLIERNKHAVSKKFWNRVEEIYLEKYGTDNKFIATFEIIFLIGWKSHDTQQKPLKPGSAKHRLADHLHVVEEKL